MKTQTFGKLLSAGFILTGVTDMAAGNKGVRPDIIFIMTDQQFSDAMSFSMGNKYLHTPNMDKLAAQGVVFNNAYASNPLSVPSRSSIFTGRYPHETNITRNYRKNEENPEIYRANLPNLGQFFYVQGYQTAYFGKTHLMYNVADVKESGFEYLIESDNDSIVTVKAVDFLKRKSDKPLLMVVSYTNPHNVCEYARNLRGRNQPLSCGEIGYPDENTQLPPVPYNLAPQVNEPDGMSGMRKAYQSPKGLFPVVDFTPYDWQKLRWGYYRMIEKVDAQLGLVLNELKENDPTGQTIIVFTSDHGECAGAHGWNQKTVFYEESVRVPLIISREGYVYNRKVSELVNIGIDILPTLLDFAGLKVPSELPGLSLKPLVEDDGKIKWRQYLVVQNNLAQATATADSTIPELKGRMIRTARYKYCIYDKGRSRESLVDLEKDPGEMVNLAGNPVYRSVLLRHRTLLKKFACKHGDKVALKMLEQKGVYIP